MEMMLKSNTWSRRSGVHWPVYCTVTGLLQPAFGTVTSAQALRKWLICHNRIQFIRKIPPLIPKTDWPCTVCQYVTSVLPGSSLDGSLTKLLTKLDLLQVLWVCIQQTDFGRSSASGHLRPARNILWNIEMLSFFLSRPEAGIIQMYLTPTFAWAFPRAQVSNCWRALRSGVRHPSPRFGLRNWKVHQSRKACKDVRRRPQRRARLRASSRAQTRTHAQ